jgi:hypothetical protein
MTSSYTINSGIEKPASGDQAGTWGTTANLNYDIIDRVMSGVTTLTLSGTSSTLLTSDAALSDGHYKVLLLGGSPSGTHTVTISPNDQSKIYFVQNNSGQTVIFSQGSGANATIANGEAGIIYANGAGASADVATLINNTSLTTATIGTLNVSTSSTLVGDMLLTGVFPDGTDNVAVGEFALGGASSTVTSGNYNVAVGDRPLRYATTGDYNVAVGFDSMGGSSVTGSHNIALGNDAGYAMTSGSGNVLIGQNAGELVSSGAENIFVGRDAGKAFLTGNDSVFIGARAGFNAQTDSLSVCIGEEAGYTMNGSGYNVYMGHQAGYYTTTGSNNIAIGNEAGEGVYTGGYNVYIGDTAGKIVDNATSNNVAAGRYAGYESSSEGNDISLGYFANRQSKYATLGAGFMGYNIGIGANTNGGLSSSATTYDFFDNNISIGKNAGGYLVKGANNVFIGEGAGPSVSTSSGTSNNIAIGLNALKSINPSIAAGNNIAIGRECGDELTDADDNILIGRNAGTTGSPGGPITTSDNNICLGGNMITNAYIKVAWTVTSDIRDKTNVGTVPHGLDFLSRLTPISYQHVDDRESRNPTGNVRYGYSAQDVLYLEGSDSVIVNNKNPDNLMLNETHMIPVLHNAILELKEENKALKARLDAAGL